MKSMLFPLIFAASVFVRSTEARINATGAIEVFLIYDCATCSKDKNSIFCSEASGGDTSMFVNNGTVTVNIQMKKTDPHWNPDYNPPAVTSALGPADGAKYCWSGTFGKLTNQAGNYTDLLGSANVLVNLDCNSRNLFYRQCIIPADMAVILMAVGSIAFVTATTLICFCCGCCKFCNEKGDESKWGCCNRFCPWCTLCADKHLREKEHTTELTEERSLTGKSSKLNEAYGKSLNEKSENAGIPSTRNPMLT